MRFLGNALCALLLSDACHYACCLLRGSSLINVSTAASDASYDLTSLINASNAFRKLPSHELGDAELPQHELGSHHVAHTLGSTVEANLDDWHLAQHAGVILLWSLMDTNTWNPIAMRIVLWVVVPILIAAFMVWLICIIFARQIRLFWEHRVSPEVFGVTSTIDSLWINPFTCTAHIKGLIMKNPRGYKSCHLMRVEDIIINLNVLQIIATYGKHIQVDYLKMRCVSLTYENIMPNLTSNLQDIIRHEKENEYWSEHQKVTIHEVYVEDIHVTAATSTVYGITSVEGPCPDIHHEDFGATASTIGKVAEQLSEAVIADENVKLLKSRIAEFGVSSPGCLPCQRCCPADYMVSLTQSVSACRGMEYEGAGVPPWMRRISGYIMSKRDVSS